MILKINKNKNKSDEKRNDLVNLLARMFSNSPVNPPLSDRRLRHHSNMFPTILKWFPETKRIFCTKTDMKRSHLCRNVLASSPTEASMNLLLSNLDEKRRNNRSRRVAFSGFGSR